MNFGKLLAVGRSMVNSRAEVAYRSDKQFYLPKFGPAKNPFTKAPEEVVARPAIDQATEEKVVARPVIAKTEGGEVREQKATVREVAQRPAIVRPNIFGQGATESRPTTGAPVVQPELSLDTVKVVHNDLSDAEVEVVPLKSRSGIPELSPAKKSWEILGERLLRATAL